MTQDSLNPALVLHTRNSEPEGYSYLRRLAGAAKEKKTDPEAAEWLEQAMTDMQSSVDPKKALSLTRRPGRPAASNKEQWEQITVGARVDRLRDDGLSYEKAVGQVADERHLSDSSVKRYYKKYRNVEKVFPFRQFQYALGELSQGIGALVSEIQVAQYHSSVHIGALNVPAAHVARGEFFETESEPGLTKMSRRTGG